MSPQGRPKDEYRSAEHEGSPLHPQGRPKDEYRSAEHEGAPLRASAAEAWGSTKARPSMRGCGSSSVALLIVPSP